MHTIRVGAAALNQTPLDWDHNQNNIIEAIKEAKQKNISVLCLPELCITGYGCEDTFLSTNTQVMALKALKKILPHTESIVVAIGLPILFREGLYNTVCLCANGKILGFTAKQYLAGDGVHYEPRWFKAWPGGVSDTLNLFNIEGQEGQYPIGDLIFDLNGIRIGFEICEDAWVATRTGVSLACRGVDLILNCSASHFSFGKSDIRKRFVQEGARAFGVAYIYANLLGNEAGRIIYDGDTIIAFGSKFLKCGPRFSFKDRVIFAADIDIDMLRMQRVATIGAPSTLDHKAGIVYSRYTIPVIDNEDFVSNKDFVSNEDFVSKDLNATDIEVKDKNDNWEHLSTRTEEEFTRAVALGLFDYLRKSKLKGFVINLSGGADSAATACLVYLMVRLSLNELGVEGFFKKQFALKWWVKESKENKESTDNKEITDGKKITDSKEKNKNFENKENLRKINDIQYQDIMNHILFALYQETENSSLKSKHGASTVASAIHCQFAAINIDDIIKQYIKLMEPCVNRTINWKEDDITLQNIQARARSPSIWMLGNIRQSIVLVTSNRSELALGYCTMDGDTSGGLAPIAGVDKTFILDWLKWLEKIGPKDIGPISALEIVNQAKPTAELRPKEHSQTDETDLMPYVWMDRIERLFVREKHSPREILNILMKQYREMDGGILAQYIDAFFVNWCKNQWKRERLAPSFHLDKQNIDPRTWCRFPILSGSPHPNPLPHGGRGHRSC